MTIEDILRKPIPHANGLIIIVFMILGIMMSLVVLEYFNLLGDLFYSLALILILFGNRAAKDTPSRSGGILKAMLIGVLLSLIIFNHIDLFVEQVAENHQ